MSELILGMVLTAVSWVIAWGDFGVLSENAFLPLWLGFILLVNGLSFVLFRESLLRDMRANFLWLFLISIPLWWLFEFLNSFVLNWYYIFPHRISNSHFFVLATLDFSTVVPSVLSVAYLLWRIVAKKNWKFSWKKLSVSKSVLLVLGIVSLGAVVLWPRYAFPLVWLANLFLFEFAVRALRLRSFSADLARGEWGSTIALCLSALVTGFWWECWNYSSMPKWIYTVPFVDFWKVFEMPIIGYGGYLPFGLAVFSFAVCSMHYIAKFTRTKIDMDIL